MAQEDSSSSSDREHSRCVPEFLRKDSHPMRRVPILLVGIALASATLLGQTQASPSFEVASVKPNTLRQGIRGHSFPGDRFEATKHVDGEVS